MEDPLPGWRQPAQNDVCVRVRREESELEEQDGDRPERGRAAEPGQDRSRDHRLDLEEQEGGEKRDERIQHARVQNRLSGLTYSWRARSGRRIRSRDVRASDSKTHRRAPPVPTERLARPN